MSWTSAPKNICPPCYSWRRRWETRDWEKITEGQLNLRISLRCKKTTVWQGSTPKPSFLNMRSQVDMMERMITCLTEWPLVVWHPSIRIWWSWIQAEVAEVIDVELYVQSYTLSDSLTAVASMSRDTSSRWAHCNLDLFIWCSSYSGPFKASMVGYFLFVESC